jgi:hypothetical protein
MTWTILLGILLVIIIVHFFLQKSGVLIRPPLYQKKGRAMNESEQALYINLQKILGDRYIILSKIRIEDFVEAVKGRGHYGARGRIKSRHVDFLICNRTTTEPLLAIELDGKSHRAEKRQDRDHFVDTLYESIELPVKHIPVGSNFAEWASRINDQLSGNGSVSKVGGGEENSPSAPSGFSE